MSRDKLEIYNYDHDLPKEGELQFVILVDTDYCECDIHSSLMYESQLNSYISEYNTVQIDTYGTVFEQVTAYFSEGGYIIIFPEVPTEVGVVNSLMNKTVHFIEQVIDNLRRALSHVDIDKVNEIVAS